VTRFFEKYYTFGLVVALVAPLWLGAIFSQHGAGNPPKDALIWTGTLFGCWLLSGRYSAFRLRGTWRRPTAGELKLYLRLLLGVLVVDFGSKALFFRWNRPGQVEVFKNFGLHSVFHVTEFESFHLILLLYFLYLFFIGALYFRFSSKVLDHIWLVSCAFALGGATALFGERFLFGGVHDSFYFAGPLMWICPPCASPRFSSYAWTPADLFVHAAFMPIVILIASYFGPSAQPENTTP
jgi:lipoprotein signal peptidase